MFGPWNMFYSILNVVVSYSKYKIGKKSLSKSKILISPEFKVLIK